jgi:hypothetical protein
MLGEDLNPTSARTTDVLANERRKVVDPTAHWMIVVEDAALSFDVSRSVCSVLASLDAASTCARLRRGGGRRGEEKEGLVGWGSVCKREFFLLTFATVFGRSEVVVIVVSASFYVLEVKRAIGFVRS